MRDYCMIAALAGGLCLLGCNGKTATAPLATAPETAAAAALPAGRTQQATQPIAVPASAAPDQVITVFLNALRTGDSPTTESLLTAKAREELTKHSMSVDVQSAPNAVYE